MGQKEKCTIKTELNLFGERPKKVRDRNQDETITSDVITVVM